MNDSFEEKATVIGYESRQSCVLSEYYLWLLILDNLFIFKWLVNFIFKEVIVDMRKLFASIVQWIKKQRDQDLKCKNLERQASVVDHFYKLEPCSQQNYNNLWMISVVGQLFPLWISWRIRENKLWVSQYKTSTTYPSILISATSSGRSLWGREGMSSPHLKLKGGL